MTVFTVIGAVLGVAAVVYLVIALIRPETLGPRPRRLRAARRRVERGRRR